MMVLRHLGATAVASAVACRNENTSEEDRTIVAPMDLSKSKSGSSSSSDAIPLNLGNKNPIIAIPSPIMRPLSSSSRSSENIINNNNIITNINNNDISAKSHNFNNYKSDSPVNFSTRRSSPSSVQQPPPNNSTVVSSSPHASSHNNNNTLQQNRRNSRKSDLRWRELSSVVHHHVSGDDDDNNTYSSPDSGLHRDSPGEEDEVSSTKPLSPSTMWRNLAAMSASSTKYISNNSASGTPLLRKQTQQPGLIPLSLIRAKYNHTNVSPDRFSSWDEEHLLATPEKHRSEGGGRGDQTKRARLEEMVSQIKTTKDPRTRNYSGDDDDMSSGGHVTSSDEVVDDGPTDLRNNVGYRGGRGGGDKRMMLMGGSGRKEVESDKVAMNLIKDEYDDEEEDDEPCNLAYPKSSSPRPDGLDISQWKKQAQFKNSSSPFPLSPTDAAKLYGIDPDTYQQQIMQLQLTSAAMLGDPGSLLKALGSYPPWVYMGYYSQLLQSFQAQEILRQYAIQSTNQSQSPSTQGEKVNLKKFKYLNRFDFNIFQYLFTKAHLLEITMFRTVCIVFPPFSITCHVF